MGNLQNIYDMKKMGSEGIAAMPVVHLAETSLPSYDEVLKRCPDYFEQALTSKEVAALIDSTPAALAQMRSRGTGPVYYRLPTITSLDSLSRPRGPIRYTRRDVIEWLHSQKRYVNTTQEVVGGAA